MGASTNRMNIVSHHDHDAALYLEASLDNGRIFLPLPPAIDAQFNFEMEVYARFMRHIRMVPNTSNEIKILSSIQFTADMMDHGDALVARILVDLGLRAPKRSFPQAYIHFIEGAARRAKLHHEELSVPVRSLIAHWEKCEEEDMNCDRHEIEVSAMLMDQIFHAPSVNC
jgi:hypothetical protein